MMVENMAKLFFQSSDVETRIIPSITRTIDELNTSLSIARSLSVPPEFECAGYLNELSSVLSQVQNSLGDVRDWLQTSLRVYRLRLDTMEQQVLVLPRSKIGVKIGRIL